MARLRLISMLARIWSFGTHMTPPFVLATSLASYAIPSVGPLFVLMLSAIASLFSYCPQFDFEASTRSLLLDRKISILAAAFWRVT